MTAVELAGGPNFESFHFEPGRLDNEEGRVSLDGLLPNAGCVSLSLLNNKSSNFKSYLILNLLIYLLMNFVIIKLFSHIHYHPFKY